MKEELKNEDVKVEEGIETEEEVLTEEEIELIKTDIEHLESIVDELGEDIHISEKVYDMALLFNSIEEFREAVRAERNANVTFYNEGIDRIDELKQKIAPYEDD